MNFFKNLFGGGEAPAKSEQTSQVTLHTAETTGPKLNAQGEISMSPELQKAVSEQPSADAWRKVELGKIHSAEAELAAASAEAAAAKTGEETTPVNVLERI